MGRGARVGAAVIAAGMSLAGPLVGVASAESGEADGASVSAGAGDARGGAQQESRRESRAGRVAREASGAPRGAVAVRQRAGGVASRAVAPAQSGGLAVEESSDSGPGSVGVAGVESSARGVTTLEPAEQVAVTEPVVAASAGFYLRERVTAADVRQSVAGLSSAVSGFVDAVSRLVSLVPGGPFSELVAGALQLVRRGLFNQAPAVAPRVLVGEVLRPMTGEDWAFSTSLEGAVAGSLGAVDPEGAPLSYTLSRAPQFGTVRIDADGSWVYTPGDGAGDQADEFAVSVADGGWNILDPFAAPTEVTVGVHAVSSSNKPGLIASDWLEIVKTTGEVVGDEPVMLTMVMTTSLGVPGSTRVWVVDKFPNQIGSQLSVGNKVPIPNEDGDIWIDYGDKLKPLTWDAWSASYSGPMSVVSVDVTDGGNGYLPSNLPSVTFEGGLQEGGRAATGRAVLEVAPSPDPFADDLYRVDRIEITDPGAGYIDTPKVVIEGPGGPFPGATAKATVGAPLALPVILVATLMLEGDFTPSGVVGTLGSQVEVKLLAAGKELENTKVYSTDLLNGDTRSLIEAGDRIKKAVAVTGADVYLEVAKRFASWIVSIGDPDDPVGVGVAGFIPLDVTFLDELKAFSIDPRQLLGLDAQYMSASTSRQMVQVIPGQGKVSSVRVDSGGYGYDSTNPPTVEFRGGLADGGVAATGRAILAPYPSPGGEDEMGDTVVRIEITNPGKGYSAAPEVVISVEPLSQGATATAFIDSPTSIWDFDLAARFGFLVPPSYNTATGGKPQGWETTYAGDYADNDWAEWKVETEGWSRINW